MKTMTAEELVANEADVIDLTAYRKAVKKGKPVGILLTGGRRRLHTDVNVEEFRAYMLKRLEDDNFVLGLAHSFCGGALMFGFADKGGESEKTP